MQCRHFAIMAVTITVRNVPEAVRNTLAARAAEEGQSMQEYLRLQLDLLAKRPSPRQWVERVQRRKRRQGAIVPAELILQAREEDHK
jgi:antitoxin FitA